MINGLVSYTEIARELGLTPRQVERACLTGLRKLRSQKRLRSLFRQLIDVSQFDFFETPSLPAVSTRAFRDYDDAAGIATRPAAVSNSSDDASRLSSHRRSDTVAA